MLFAMCNIRFQFNQLNFQLLEYLTCFFFFCLMTALKKYKYIIIEKSVTKLLKTVGEETVICVR